MGGYLYLMERTSHNTGWSKVTFQKEIKIGISKTPMKRRASVDRSTKGNIDLILQAWFIFPRIFENRLHKMFDCSRFAIRTSGKSNGHKEWFYLNWLELLIVIAWIRWWQVRWWIFFIALFIGALLFSEALFLGYSNKV